jgi:hypothetical protein
MATMAWVGETTCRGGRGRRLMLRGASRRLAPLLFIALFATAAAPSSSAAREDFRIGYGDPELASESASARNLWAKKAVESGASIARINVSWASIAPQSPPAGFNPANPSSPGYSWQNLDAAVRTAAAHGLTVLFTVQHAPVWAEGPGRPADIKQGAWRPDAAGYGAFGQALATRYSGSFPDPLAAGSTLPRVRYFDAWNEPNLVNFLAPQVAAGKLVGPAMYRKLLNRFYAGVKQAQPGATVLGSSFAPFGATNGTITPPVAFLRNLLCLSGGRLNPLPCPEKAHLDALSTHPIQVGPPTESAPNPLDVTTPDLGRLTKVVRAARRKGTVRSSGRIGLWVTEFWCDSKPPDPKGIPAAEQARWYEQDMYEFWKAGAEVAIELQLRDWAPGSEGFAATLQSGVYFRDGRPKPSATAMRFPFVAESRGLGVSVWGIAPRAGAVHIQALRGGAWKTIGTVSAAGRGRPFTAHLPPDRVSRLRARVGAESSLPWKLS